MAEDYTQHDMSDYQIWVIRSIREWIALGNDKDRIWAKGTRAPFQSRLNLAGLTLAEAYQAAITKKVKNEEDPELPQTVEELLERMRSRMGVKYQQEEDDIDEQKAATNNGSGHSFEEMFRSG